MDTKNKKMKKLKCYIASPWFDKEKLGCKEIELIKKILDNKNIDYFSPKDENLINPKSNNEDRKKGFDSNVNAILKCDFVIANTRDKDLGVSIEVGIAYANKIPVILFTPQIKDYPLNLMLAVLCISFSFNEKELIQSIDNFITNKLSLFRGEIE